MGCGVNVEFDSAQRPRRTYAAVKAATVEMRLTLALALHPIGVTVNAGLDARIYCGRTADGCGSDSLNTQAIAVGRASWPVSRILFRAAAA
jgi:NAD(P)-dependent dehydrogenase (short-subunit alcohol dehydrogenase family)